MDTIWDVVAHTLVWLWRHPEALVAWVVVAVIVGLIAGRVMDDGEDV